MLCVPNILCRNCGNICMAIEFVEKLVFYYDVGCVCGESILVSLSGTNTATLSETVASKPQQLLPTLPNFPTLPSNLINMPNPSNQNYQQNQNNQPQQQTSNQNYPSSQNNQQQGSSNPSQPSYQQNQNNQQQHYPPSSSQQFNPSYQSNTNNNNNNNNQFAYARPTPHYFNQNQNYPMYPMRHSPQHPFSFLPLKFAKELFINELSVHKSFGHPKLNSIDATKNSTKQYTLIETTKKP